MSGNIPQRMDYPNSVSRAENETSVIYNLAEQSLMAHTLRAVETLIRKEYKKRIFPIILQVEKGVMSRYGSKSWAIVTDFNAFIVVDEDLAHNQKRVCIAHECFHVLEFFRPVKSDRQNIEEICDAFANTLCKKHHEYYCKPENVDKCKFEGLPINCRRH